MSWWNEALCKGATKQWDEELGDAVEYGPGAAALNIERTGEKIFNAKCGCAICPVQPDCLLEAISGPTDPFKGLIAGGLTTEERLVLRSRRAEKARCDQRVDGFAAHPLEPAGPQPEHVG